MDHFLATAQHNAVHLLEMVQDVMFKLLKRQQNAQFIVAFLQLVARQEDPDTLFFNRELSIEGDTELGLIVKNMLDAVEWPKLPQIPAFRH